MSGTAFPEQHNCSLCLRMCQSEITSVEIMPFSWVSSMSKKNVCFLCTVIIFLPAGAMQIPSDPKDAFLHHNFANLLTDMMT